MENQELKDKSGLDEKSQTIENGHEENDEHNQSQKASKPQDSSLKTNLLNADDLKDQTPIEY